MLKSVLEAVKEGQWDYEPPSVACDRFDACDAMPGTAEKVETMAERVRSGLPLWHLADRCELDAPPVRKPR